MVGHLGGETLLQEAGTLELTRALGQSPIALTEVFVVEPDMLPAGVVGLFGVADIAALGVSLDAVMANPGRPWEQSVPLSRFTRIRNSFRRFFGFARAAPAIAVRTDLAIPDHAPLDRRPIVARRGVPRDLPATPRLTEERRGLLDATKQRLSDEQGKRTANRVAKLFVEGQARKRALQAAKLAESQRFFQQTADSARTSSSAEAPRYPPSQTWPRRRQKFYAVRKGRTLGIFDNWEDCERQVKGIASEFKSFSTLEEAKAYLVGRRLNFLLHRCSIKGESNRCPIKEEPVFGRRFNFMLQKHPSKAESSFVGGKALRAKLDVWQDGHADSIRVICGLDTMSDVNLSLIELLHDVHEIIRDDVRGCAGKSFC